MKIALAVILFFETATAFAEVRIVDRQGRPVPNARVEFVLQRAGPSAQATSALLPLRRSFLSGPDGEVAFDRPRTDRVAIFVDHPDFEPRLILGPEVDPANEIRLQRGFVWHGLVTGESLLEAHSPSGSPRGNVCASGHLPLGSSDEVRVWQRCGNLDETGRFRLAGLPSGTMRVEAHVPGFIPLVAEVDPRRNTTLSLEHGRRVRAVVRDGRARPVTTAVCRADERAKARTDAEGRCILGVAEFPVRLTIRAPGFREWGRQIAAEEELEVQLTPTEQVFGTIFRSNGEPVTEATVRIEQTTTEGRTLSTRRDLDLEDGRFILDLPSAGTYAFRFEIPGHLDHRFGPVAVDQGKGVSLGSLFATEGASIAGRVVDRTTGEPLEGVVLEVLPLGPLLLRAMDRGNPFDVSGPEGEFVVGGLGIGRYALQVRRKGIATLHHLVDVPRIERISLGTLWGVPGATLEVRTPSRDSNSDTPFEVLLFDPARELLEPIASVTNTEDGSARADSLAPARYRAEVRRDRLLRAEEVEVASEGTVIVFGVAGPRVRGQVVRDGLPVAGGFVRIVPALEPSSRRGKMTVQRGSIQVSYGLPESSLIVPVDETGRFEIVGAPMGRMLSYYVGTRGERIVRAVTIPDADDADVLVELAGLPLEIRVVDQRSGTGVEATVDLRWTNGLSLIAVETDRDGWARFDDLEPGTYAVTARAAGYASAGIPALNLTSRTSRQVLGLRRGDAGSIHVELTRTDGSAVEGVPVTVYDDSGTLVRSLPTDASGKRRFDELAEGDYFVAWTDPLAGATGTDRNRVEAGRILTVRSTLEPGASVILLCPSMECAGAPIERLEVLTADGLDLSPLLSGITMALHFSSDGELALGRLSRGEYRFRLGLEGRIWERNVTIGQGIERVQLR